MDVGAIAQIEPDRLHEPERETASLELIEAAARTGRHGQAPEALESLSRSTTTSGTPWASNSSAEARVLPEHGASKAPTTKTRPLASSVPEDWTRAPSMAVVAPCAG